MLGKVTAVLFLFLLSVVIASAGTARYVCVESCAHSETCCLETDLSCCETVPRDCCDELEGADEEYVSPNSSKAPAFVPLFCLPSEPRIEVARPGGLVHSSEFFGSPDPPPLEGRDVIVRTQKWVV